MDPVEKPKHKYLPVLLTVLIMLFVVALVGGGVWYYADQQAKKTADDNATQVAALQKQIDDLNKKTTTPSTSTTPTATSADWHTYTNTDYGFQLTFGDKWVGVTSKKLSNPGNSMSAPGTPLAEYTFSLPTKDSTYVSLGNNPSQVFNVTVYNTTDYQNLVKQGGPYPTIIVTKDGKTYAYGLATQWPSDWTLSGGVNGDVKTVINTFKFN